MPGLDPHSAREHRLRQPAYFLGLLYNSQRCFIGFACQVRFVNLDLERFILQDSAFAILTLLANMREIPFDDGVIGLAELRVVSPTVATLSF
jgi:hypothetical protein